MKGHKYYVSNSYTSEIFGFDTKKQCKEKITELKSKNLVPEKNSLEAQPYILTNAELSEICEINENSLSTDDHFLN